MKRTSRVLAILLALAMLLSVTAFAAWNVYGGNYKHNAVVENAPTSTTPIKGVLSLPHTGSGWDGIDNVPVMQTVGNKTYAYVLYDGYNDGAQVAKVDVTTGTPSLVWNKGISGKNGFQLSTPYLDAANDALYVGAAGATANTGVSGRIDVNLVDGKYVAKKTYSGLTLPDKTNRVAVSVYFGRTQVVQQLPTAKGTAKLTLGGTTVNLTLDPTSTTADYNIYVQESSLPDGNKIYDYYYAINQNIVAQSTENVSLEVEVSLDGTYSVPEVSMLGNAGAIVKLTGVSNPVVGGVVRTDILGNISGQINTPLVKQGKYLYFGTWNGNNAMKYYQIDLTDNSYKTFDGANGFYWAGAVVYGVTDTNPEGTYVFFGSDNGILYGRSVSAFDTAGTSLTLPNAGNIRSTIMLDGDNLYFTSQAGYLWCCTFNSSNNALSMSWSCELGGTSTSTPTKVDDRIYVGVYTGFNTGGVLCVDADIQTITPVVQIETDNKKPVQCSIVAMSGEDGVDYLYFNTNSNVGRGYCYSFDGETGTQVWETASDTYALGGMACDNGIIVFGNDYDNLYTVK